MPVDIELLKRWRGTLAGSASAYQPSDFTYILEDPTEFDLRLLLQSFDDRDSLIEKIGRYLFDPAPALSPAELVSVVEASASEIAELGRLVGIDVAVDEHPQRIVVDCEESSPAVSSSSLILESSVDTALVRLRDVTGGLYLWEAVYGASSDPVACLHLTADLHQLPSDLRAFVKLHRSGRRMWIAESVAFVAKPQVERRWANATGWSPQMEWPSDEDIAQQYVIQEATMRSTQRAQATTTTSAELAELAGHVDDLVRAQVARNPRTPTEVLELLSADHSSVVASSVAGNSSAPPKAIEIVLKNEDPAVRIRVAKRLELDGASIETLLNDTHSGVRLALAGNSSLSEESREILQSDADERVRRRASKPFSEP